RFEIAHNGYNNGQLAQLVQQVHAKRLRVKSDAKRRSQDFAAFSDRPGPIGPGRFLSVPDFTTAAAGMPTRGDVLPRGSDPARPGRAAGDVGQAGDHGRLVFASGKVPSVRPCAMSP